MHAYHPHKPGLALVGIDDASNYEQVLMTSPSWFTLAEASLCLSHPGNASSSIAQLHEGY